MRLPSRTSHRARAFNVLLCVVVVAALVVPAVATAVAEKITEEGTSASCWFGEYDPNSGTWTYVSLGAGRSTRTTQSGGGASTTEESSAWVYIDQWGPWGYRYGWTDAMGVNFTGDQMLTSARFDQTMNLWFWGWSDSASFPTGPVSMKFDVQWTGTGTAGSWADSGFWRNWGRHHWGNNGNHYGQSGYGKSGYKHNNGNHYGQSGYGRSGYKSNNGNHYGQSGYGRSGYGRSGYNGWGRGPRGLSDYINKYEWAEMWRSAAISGSIIDGINGTDYLVSPSPVWADMWSYSRDSMHVGIGGQGTDNESSGQVNAAVEAATKKAEAAVLNAAAASDMAAKKAAEKATDNAASAAGSNTGSAATKD